VARTGAPRKRAKKLVSRYRLDFWRTVAPPGAVTVRVVYGEPVVGESPLHPRFKPMPVRFCAV
jgi:hypothetical protein